MNYRILIAFILPLLVACNGRHESNDSGEGVRQSSQSIQMDDVETIKTHISMKAGELSVSGGAKNLVDTDIIFSHEDWQPEIEYTTTGKTGRLRIDQPDISGINFNFSDDDENKWAILLNDALPQDIDLAIGAGKTNIDLRGLKLNSVNLDAGVGEHSLNLSNTSVPQLEINAGVGEVNVDLSGTWNNDLDAEVNGGIGELNLLLPQNVGIRIEVSGALGSVNAPELNKNGRTFTNDLYGESDYVISMEVNAGIGSVNVRFE